MKKLTLIVLALAAILAAATFATTRLWAASPTASSPRVAVAQPCGSRDQVLFGHVKSLAPKGDHFELQFDPAWFTSGLTASRAQLQDTGYGDVANDNYIVEEGHRLPHEVVVVAVAPGEPVRGQREPDQPGTDDQGGEPVEPVEQDLEATGAGGALCYAPKHLIARWRPFSS